MVLAKAARSSWNARQWSASHDIDGSSRTAPAPRDSVLPSRVPTEQLWISQRKPRQLAPPPPARPDRQPHDRTTSCLVEQHLVLRASGIAHRDHRPLGCRQVHAGQTGGRGASPHHRCEVSFDGRDLHAEYAVAAPPDRAGPQDDVVHHQLTLHAALRYAAELRLPHASTKEDRRSAVRPGARGAGADRPRPHPGRQALRRAAQTRLGGHGTVDRAVAADPRRAHHRAGPGAGPPGDDHAAPARRRRPGGAGGDPLPDLPGRLRSGAVFGPRRQDRLCGPPDEIGAAMGTTDWADLFTRVAPTPTRPHREFVTRDHCRRRRGRAAAPVGARAPAVRLLRQVSTVARRQVRLILADRGYLVFLAVLPFVLGALALLVPGNAGLGWPTRAVMSPTSRRRSSCCSTSAPSSWAPR